MKFSSFFALALVSAAVTVDALPQRETNADRLARGLPPLPPVRRATPAFEAKRGAPSGTPGQCSTGGTYCCQRTSKAGLEGLLLGLLGILGIHPDVTIGVSCSPLSIIGIGGNSCSQQPVCCDKNLLNGGIATGCSPININL
ncbi:fungal hydrophobin [Dendrothele bispora CBS 962.96]|uniref:Hydrophobin n=1 Tax=Dendrothele bispora (strain CBS 962.96) TaxID=1314807 RepID=A0A4S8LGP8_DENBC|nr:fungal hydrophobin [Dendrothele bispora CBS 962.96]